VYVKGLAAATALLSLAIGGLAGANTSFSRINFDLNSAALRPDAVPMLHEGAELLQRHPELRIRIEGSSCPSEPGSLWFERAVAARTFLLQHGVDPSQIVAVEIADPKWQANMREIYKVPCSEAERAALFEDARSAVAR
jgi:hypothetical protein